MLSRLPPFRCLQRAGSARRARELRLRNAAVAAAASGRPATAGSATGWVHPPGGRHGIRTGRGNIRGSSYVDSIKGLGGERCRSGSGSGTGGMAVVGSRTGSRKQRGLVPGVRPGTAGSNAIGAFLQQLQSCKIWLHIKLGYGYQMPALRVPKVRNRAICEDGAEGGDHSSSIFAGMRQRRPTWGSAPRRTEWLGEDVGQSDAQEVGCIPLAGYTLC